MIDLAGHGNSSLSRLDYTVLSFAEDLKEVVYKEKITKQPPALAGGFKLAD